MSMMRDVLIALIDERAAEPVPYCKPADHTWVAVVGGKGYAEDYNTMVCIRCECFMGVRKPPKSCLCAHVPSIPGAPDVSCPRCATSGPKVCNQEHGHEGNPARVYGHFGSRRTCIRIKATNEWVYDPAWEATDA